MQPSGPRTQFTIRPNNPMMHQSRMIRPSVVPQLRPVRPPQQQRAPPGNSTQTSGNTSTIFSQQNGSISVARAPQPDTQFGKSKTAFEDKIINGLEICQHTINKMITLTNSTSFKTSRSFSDLKELYIHLQYLFTYTSGKIKTLQDNLVTGMEELAKHDTALKEKNEEGELEIVEQKQEVIEVLSDDEGDEPPRKTIKKESPPSTSAASTVSTEDQENADIAQELFANLVDTMQNSITKFIPQTELLSTVGFESNDKKLKTKTVVKVERLEDSKSPIVKQYMIAIQQRRDRSESRENSPMDFPFMPEVVMEMEEGESATTKENADGEEQANAEKEKENGEEVFNESTENEKSSDVVEIASDEEGDKTRKTSSENAETSETPVADKPQIREEKDDTPAVTIEGSSQEIVSTLDAEEILAAAALEEAENNSKTVEENGKENDDEKNDVSMLSDDENISKVAAAEIDDEKDLLDNLINSLDETEPLASIELENFP